MTLKDKLDSRVIKLQEKQMVVGAKKFWNELKKKQKHWMI